MLVNKATECSRFILEANEKNLAHLGTPLENPYTAPKNYWFIINRFLHSKKKPSIPPFQRLENITFTDSDISMVIKYQNID